MGQPDEEPYWRDKDKYGVIDRIITEIQSDAEAGRCFIHQLLKQIHGTAMNACSESQLYDYIVI